ncbi:expressed unknown protein [Seminavis robusta]|uniref:Uncharacterized protein n=1 Tax=Seminavis robusta TaxID=568900 RepID=A0A9N8H3S8_9STRA|nr:expressed unknown protein [Seminavis robusta]|eukprot:Sro95_g049280.1 n/a (137) ;mRNA; f:53993-54403
MMLIQKSMRYSLVVVMVLLAVAVSTVNGAATQLRGGTSAGNLFSSDPSMTMNGRPQNQLRRLEGDEDEEEKEGWLSKAIGFVSDVIAVAFGSEDEEAEGVALGSATISPTDAGTVNPTMGETAGATAVMTSAPTEE